MRCRAVLLLVTALAACAGPGYRDPADSAALEGRIRDDNIESRVRMALTQDPETAPFGSIRVSCEDGVVTLVGRVTRPEARVRAVHVASGCAGVRRVINRLSPTAAG